MKKKYSICLILLGLMLSISIVHAEMKPLPKIKAGYPPHDVIKNIVQANKISVEAKKIPSGEQTPMLTWLADPDTRIQPDLIFSNPSKRIYSVRNFANQLHSSLAAIDFGIYHLYTPVLLITGNTDNPAIFLLQEDTAQLEPEIIREIKSLRKILSISVPKKKTNKNQKQAPLDEVELVEQNIDFQVSKAVARYKKRIESGRLVVVGGVLDLVNLYGKGHGRLIIINVNGERDGEKLRNSPALSRLNPKIKAVFVGRVAAKKPLEM